MRYYLAFKGTRLEMPRQKAQVEERDPWKFEPCDSSSTEDPEGKSVNELKMKQKGHWKGVKAGRQVKSLSLRASIRLLFN